MNRRYVIKSLGLISLHSLYPSVLTGFLSGCKSGNHKTEYVFFDKEEQLLIGEMIDIILPGTNTQSAYETGVHFFLDDVFANCLHKEQKELIKEGLTHLGMLWKTKADKIEIVKTLDEKAFTGDEGSAWFKPIKRYTLIGFFTSQEGTTKAGNYVKVPDKFIGEIPIDASTLSHSKTTLKFYF